MAKNYWLVKSEPEVYSIDNLKKDKTTWWECVRNYQARNFMMNDMKVGDEVLFYHSNAEPTGIFGVAQVSKPASPDQTQFDKKSEYFDKKATKEKPIWYCVEIKYKSHLDRPITLSEIKTDKALGDMLVIKRGQRLSIQPVTKKNFEYIVSVTGTVSKTGQKNRKEI